MNATFMSEPQTFEGYLEWANSHQFVFHECWDAAYAAGIASAETRSTAVEWFDEANKQRNRADKAESQLADAQAHDQAEIEASQGERRMTERVDLEWLERAAAMNGIRTVDALALIAELQAARAVVENARRHYLCRMEGGNGEGWRLDIIESAMDASVADYDQLTKDPQ